MTVVPKVVSGISQLRYITLKNTDYFPSVFQTCVCNISTASIDDAFKRQDRARDRINLSVVDEPFLDIFDGVGVSSCFRKVQDSGTDHFLFVTL